MGVFGPHSGQIIDLRTGESREMTPEELAQPPDFDDESGTTWQPIETAPLDGTAVLLFCPGMNSWNRLEGLPDIVVGLWYKDWDGRSAWKSDIGDVDQGYESTGAYFVHEALRPTHWAPLPELPITSAK
jgi:hypothetical protein